MTRPPRLTSPVSQRPPPPAFASDSILADWTFRPAALQKLPPYVMIMLYHRIDTAIRRTKRTEHLRFVEGHPLASRCRLKPRPKRQPALPRLTSTPPLRPPDAAPDDTPDAHRARQEYAAFVLGLFATDQVIAQLPGPTLWEKLAVWERPDTVILTADGAADLEQTKLARCCREIVRNMAMRASAQRGAGSDASRLRVVDLKRAEQMAAAEVKPPNKPGEEGSVRWRTDDDGSDAGDDDFYFVEDPACRFSSGDRTAASVEAEFEAMADAMMTGARDE